MLVGHGHPDAPDYPLSFLWEESQLTVERINGLLATEAVLLNAAATTAVAAFGKDGGAKARREFDKMIKRLSGGDVPETPANQLAERLARENQGHGR